MKRKRNSNRDIILFIILIPVFLGITFFISSRMKNQIPSYSIMNKSTMGYSIFFETLKALDYPVKQTLTPIEKTDPQTIQIVKDNGQLDINDKKIKNWVQDGGVLIYLSGFHNLEYSEIEMEDNGATMYSLGKGYVICRDPSDIINKTMIESTHKAYELLQQLEEYPHRKIYFNETHLFYKISKQSMWSYVPVGVKFIIYQFIVVMIAFFYLKGKRFGKVIPLYEEVERTENEYLYSVAYLYQKAKCLDLILDSYYRSLLRKIPIIYDDWLYYWQQEGLPSVSQAKMVYQFMNNRPQKLTFKEVMHMIHVIEKLKNILNKRRESYWQTLKSNQ